MAKELSEDTSFNLSIKTLAGIAVGISVLIGFWYQIQGDIQEAKELPLPEVGRTEFSLKDELVRSSIMSIQDKVNSNSEKLDKIDEKLFEIIQR